MKEITLFISYSHDSEEHREFVLSLSERLRKDGIDTILDRYVEGAPPEGWPRWMMNQLDCSTKVICICTENYYRRFRGHEIPGKGKGVDWEGAIITQELYDARSKNQRFIPVLFTESDSAYIPERLGSTSHYVLDSEKSYKALYEVLLDQAGVEPRKISKLKIKDAKVRNPLRFNTKSGTSTTGSRNQDSALRSIDISRILKYAPAELIGLEDEIGILEEAWNKTVNAATPRAHVLGFIALGGEGKTSLVAKWAANRGLETPKWCWHGLDWDRLIRGYGAISSRMESAPTVRRVAAKNTPAYGKKLLSNRQIENE